MNIEILSSDSEAVADEALADVDLFNFVDVVDCPQDTDEAAHDDDDDLDGIAEDALAALAGFPPGGSEVLIMLGDGTVHMHVEIF